MTRSESRGIAVRCERGSDRRHLSGCIGSDFFCLSLLHSEGSLFKQLASCPPGVGCSTKFACACPLVTWVVEFPVRYRRWPGLCVAFLCTGGVRLRVSQHLRADPSSAVTSPQCSSSQSLESNTGWPPAPVRLDSTACIWQVGKTGWVKG